MARLWPPVTLSGDTSQGLKVRGINEAAPPLLQAAEDTATLLGWRRKVPCHDPSAPPASPPGTGQAPATHPAAAWFARKKLLVMEAKERLEPPCSCFGGETTPSDGYL